MPRTQHNTAAERRQRVRDIVADVTDARRALARAADQLEREYAIKPAVGLDRIVARLATWEVRAVQ